MGISFSFYIPSDNDLFLTKLYASGGNCEWAEALLARGRTAAETVDVHDLGEVSTCAVLTASEILAVQPGPPDPSEAPPGLQGRAVIAYLRTLPPDERVAVHLGW
jgi:hypothetical protein